MQSRPLFRSKIGRGIYIEHFYSNNTRIKVLNVYTSARFTTLQNRSCSCFFGRSGDARDGVEPGYPRRSFGSSGVDLTWIFFVVNLAEVYTLSTFIRVNHESKCSMYIPRPDLLRSGWI